jgi:hypothetical protein
MASFFHRQFFRAPNNVRALGIGMGTVIGGFGVSACDNKPEEVAKTKRMDYVGVFLDAQSQKLVKERFPALHQNGSAVSSVILKYNPCKEELHVFEPIMGHAVKVQLQAFAHDEHTQAVCIYSNYETNG